MKQAIAGLLMMLAAVSARADEYVFRNDERPVYDKTVTVDQLESLRRDLNKLVLIDVRLREDFEADPVLIPGAAYRDPERIEAWFTELPADAEVVVYCVKGKWVSQKAAHFLDGKGLHVRSLEGGIEAWKEKADRETPDRPR